MRPLPLPGERLVRGGALEHLDGGRGQLLHSLDVGGDLEVVGATFDEQLEFGNLLLQSNP